MTATVGSQTAMAASMSEAQGCRCGCGRAPANRYALYIIGHRPKEDVNHRFDRGYEVDKSSGCWNWLGKPIKGGYGRFWDGAEVVMAHRFALGRVEPLDLELEVDHLCRNTSCVNPDHLEQVTGQENKRRAIASRPRVSCCKRGHLYDETNTIVNSNGYRECRICRVTNRQAWLKSRRESRR